VVEKLKKEEDGFDFVFIGEIDSESKSMQILSFFCLEVYLKLYLRLKLI
jgi:hypothetical protein